MKTTLFAAATLAAASFAVPANAAAPGLATALGTAAQVDTQLEQVHLRNRHSTCQWSRFTSWHRHDRFGRTIACRPFSRWRR